MRNSYLLNDNLPPVKSQLLNTHKPINVLLIGNNPGELGALSNILKASRRKFNVEAIFCVRNCLKWIFKNTPHSIVIDENIGQENVEELLDVLSTDFRSNNIPITILRQENHPKIYYSAVQTYVIKEKITKEGITNAILTAIKSKKNQRYFYTTYADSYSILGGTFYISKSKFSNLMMLLKKWIPLGNPIRNM